MTTQVHIERLIIDRSVMRGRGVASLEADLARVLTNLQSGVTPPASDPAVSAIAVELQRIITGAGGSA